MIINDNKNLEHCNKCIDDEKYRFTYDQCNRKKYLNSCLPLFNIKDCNHNILDIDDYYINYNERYKLTYRLKKDFTFELVDVGPEERYRDFMNILYSHIHKNMIITGEYNNNSINIPVYYFFINKNNVIFNIFIEVAKQLNIDIKKIFTTINNTTSKFNDKFLAFSHNFNIFNVSLFCGNFFEIYDYIIGNFSDLIRIDTEIEKKEGTLGEENRTLYNYYYDIFQKLFEDFKLNNLYNIIEYVKKYSAFSKLKETNYTNNKIKTLIPPFQKIHMTEDNRFINSINKDIMKDLFHELINIIKIIDYISLIIEDYIYIFLLSVLYYRLNISNSILGTWTISSNKYYQIILNKIIETGYLNRYYNQLINKLYNINSPLLKSYTHISYKNNNFSNCMENTILQLFKILLYNPENRNYDENYINIIIKDKYIEEITHIFNTIHLEDTPFFNNLWISFLYKIPNIKYVETNYEMAANKFNLYNVLIHICHDVTATADDADDADVSLEILLNNIVKLLNNEYDIDTSDIDTYTIDINIYNNYKLHIQESVIDHNGSRTTAGHAFIYIENKDYDEANLINIFKKKLFNNKIKIYNYLSDHRTIHCKYYNIEKFILLKIILIPPLTQTINLSNITNELYYKYNEEDDTEYHYLEILHINNTDEDKKLHEKLIEIVTDVDICYRIYHTPKLLNILHTFTININLNNPVLDSKIELIYYNLWMNIFDDLPSILMYKDTLIILLNCLSKSSNDKIILNEILKTPDIYSKIFENIKNIKNIRSIYDNTYSNYELWHYIIYNSNDETYNYFKIHRLWYQFIEKNKLIDYIKINNNNNNNILKYLIINFRVNSSDSSESISNKRFWNDLIKKYNVEHILTLFNNLDDTISDELRDNIIEIENYILDYNTEESYKLKYIKYKKKYNNLYKNY